MPKYEAVYTFTTEQEKEAKELRSELYQDFNQVDIYSSLHDIRVVATNIKAD